MCNAFSLKILKRCKLKQISIIPNWGVRLYNTDVSKVKVSETPKLEGDQSLIEVLPSWKADEEPELRQAVVRHMRVIPDFVSEAEEAALLAEVEPQLKRMRYEYDHWDNAIEGYRETERAQWGGAAEAAMRRVRAAFPAGARLLAAAHVLDLAAAGHIRPHVDAVRFCGDTIAGLCLLSAAVMRLAHLRRPHLALDALLQRRALYIMSGVARYEFNHAVLGGEASVWRGARLPRKRRVAIICREQPPPQD
ncbi:alpha-ketoglutarate-dependent dioxygenase alkB homolog 7, mitochondrial [Aricia agestis]|uniref:alpha-ketoglutarate-dependent dioxygenase alkB homolog 7, mitochondrial n=1 Tax=Aricia agestis TaxID=91739 RepID=UPI001C20793A|nr:alpha-ketoglutarate-dependent dioxygenase alkB homolog 7, mitochondrial [Aricia agestis]XP_041972263.1 alpha-ketoglutarate-dependent dioxygenase alkB homolog 7, mitochondrial [Aricia agestis]XP_041972264.1 alpha-ketoglutarate-dependent dioxygenase alkB homolog 7, mitochondrial [Aricia agestis]